MPSLFLGIDFEPRKIKGKDPWRAEFSLTERREGHCTYPKLATYALENLMYRIPAVRKVAAQVLLMEADLSPGAATTDVLKRRRVAEF